MVNYSCQQPLTSDVSGIKQVQKRSTEAQLEWRPFREMVQTSEETGHLCRLLPKSARHALLVESVP